MIKKSNIIQGTVHFIHFSVKFKRTGPFFNYRVSKSPNQRNSFSSEALICGFWGSQVAKRSAENPKMHTPTYRSSDCNSAHVSPIHIYIYFSYSLYIFYTYSPQISPFLCPRSKTAATFVAPSYVVCNMLCGSISELVFVRSATTPSSDIGNRYIRV